MLDISSMCVHKSYVFCAKQLVNWFERIDDWDCGIMQIDLPGIPLIYKNIQGILHSKLQFGPPVLGTMYGQLNHTSFNQVRAQGHLDEVIKSRIRGPIRAPYISPYAKAFHNKHFAPHDTFDRQYTKTDAVSTLKGTAVVSIASN